VTSGVDRVAVPPLSVLLSSGVLMPAASIDSGSWLLDSERILVELRLLDRLPILMLGA
jgi:hypothetical protein